MLRSGLFVFITLLCLTARTVRAETPDNRPPSPALPEPLPAEVILPDVKLTLREYAVRTPVSHFSECMPQRHYPEFLKRYRDETPFAEAHRHADHLLTEHELQRLEAGGNDRDESIKFVRQEEILITAGTQLPSNHVIFLQPHNPWQTSQTADTFGRLRVNWVTERAVATDVQFTRASRSTVSDFLIDAGDPEQGKPELTYGHAVQAFGETRVIAARKRGDSLWLVTLTAERIAANSPAVNNLVAGQPNQRAHEQGEIVQASAEIAGPDSTTQIISVPKQVKLSVHEFAVVVRKHTVIRPDAGVISEFTIYEEEPAPLLGIGSTQPTPPALLGVAGTSYEKILDTFVPAQSHEARAELLSRQELLVPVGLSRRGYRPEPRTSLPFEGISGKSEILDQITPIWVAEHAVDARVNVARMTTEQWVQFERDEVRMALKDQLFVDSVVTIPVGQTRVIALRPLHGPSARYWLVTLTAEPTDFQQYSVRDGVATPLQARAPTHVEPAQLAKIEQAAPIASAQDRPIQLQFSEILINHAELQKMGIHLKAPDDPAAKWPWSERIERALLSEGHAKQMSVPRMLLTAGNPARFLQETEVPYRLQFTEQTPRLREFEEFLEGATPPEQLAEMMAPPPARVGLRIDATATFIRDEQIDLQIKALSKHPEIAQIYDETLQDAVMIFEHAGEKKLSLREGEVTIVAGGPHGMSGHFWLLSVTPRWTTLLPDVVIQPDPATKRAERNEVSQSLPEPPQPEAIPADADQGVDQSPAVLPDVEALPATAVYRDRQIELRYSEYLLRPEKIRSFGLNITEDSNALRAVLETPAMLSAFASSNAVQDLGRSTILATAGRPARLRSGGEVFVPTFENGNVRPSFISREVGLTVEAVATPIDDHSIQLDSSYEQIDAVPSQVRANGYAIPGFQSRSLNSRWTLRMNEPQLLGAFPSKDETGEEVMWIVTVTPRWIGEPPVDQLPLRADPPQVE